MQIYNRGTLKVKEITIYFKGGRMNNLNLIKTDGQLYADSNFKRIYILKSSNGNVKIGVSSAVERRKSYFTSGSGYDIIDYRFTKPCSNAFEIEKIVHKHFEGFRLKGEWFSCKFEEAIEFVENAFANFAFFEKREDHVLDNMITLTGIDQIDKKLDESFKNGNSAGEVSSLVKNIRITMERQNSAPRKIARQTELLLRHFGIPVIEGFVEPESTWEQMPIPEI